jgi:hypothetical protein
MGFYKQKQCSGILKDKLADKMFINKKAVQFVLLF